MANRFSRGASLSLPALTAASFAFFATAASAQNVPTPNVPGATPPAATAPAAPAALAGNTVVGKIKSVDEMAKTITMENGTTYQAVGNVVVDAFAAGQTVTLTVDMAANPPRVLQIAQGG
jgi:hypothetical protein